MVQPKSLDHQSVILQVGQPGDPNTANKRSADKQRERTS
jgi:hypothetical protein